MKIPIIILNYNSSHDCRKCIGFLKQQEGVETEIVVVDNHSPRPGEQASIASLCQEQGCTFIQAEENRGYNAGNNIGLRYAARQGYEYALIANPDMEFPQRDYLLRMTQEMDRRPEVAVMGSDIVGPAGDHQNPMTRDGEWRESFWWFRGIFLDPLLRRHRPTEAEQDFALTRYCPKVGGCCLMVRMDFVEQIGYFDEGVFLFCEEAILCRQVERAGRRMLYLAEAQALHRHIKSEKGDPVKRYEAWLRSRKYFIRKYNREALPLKYLEMLSAHLYVWLLKANHKVAQGRKA